MIYVIGSINMDLVFDLPYMPSEGETLSSLKFATFAGGKGANQAIAISKLGHAVQFCGAVGTDSYGKKLVMNLEKYHVGCDFVKEKGEDSGLAAILMENGNNRIALSAGANARITKSDVDDALSNAQKFDILLVQLEIPLDIVYHALKLAKQKGMTTVLNPAPANDEFETRMYEYVDYITPNETETEIITGINPQDIVYTALCVKKFYSMNIKNVIITLGARGAVVSHGMNLTEIDALDVSVVDTTAAGDTFVGALCCKLEDGLDIVECCKYANSASSITVQRQGASDSIPNLKEVEAVYKKHYLKK